MFITIVCFPVRDVTNLEITLALLSSRFPICPKNQDKNVHILRTKRAFNMKQKVFFIIFKGLLVARNCLRPKSGPSGHRHK